ncbi:MAG: hypothetical protein AABO41_00750 [Acidobacteriota bacterium]
MAQEIMDSNVLDLCEEMLFARAAKGIRPLLYVSSDEDFECSVAKLLDEPRESRVWEQHRFAMPGVGQRVTNYF